MSLNRIVPLTVTISLLAFVSQSTASEPPGEITCEGFYKKHLQGVATDGDAIYWSFTTVLVKTDPTGHVVQKVDVADHHGDLCSHDGRIYVAVNLGQFNQPAGKADSWVYVYDAVTLVEIEKHRVSELVHGAGGIAHREGRFFVVGGLPAGAVENYVYEYDASFAFQKRHTVDSGYTLMGIQTIAFVGDRWWLGCYGFPRVLVQTDASFKVLGKWPIDCSLGIVPQADGRVLIARGQQVKGHGYSGRLVLAKPDEAKGLRLLDAADVR